MTTQCIFLTYYIPDIVEHLLYILWRHLQFYLVHCRPMKLSNEYGVKGMTDPRDPTMRRLQGYQNSTSIYYGIHMILHVGLKWLLVPKITGIFVNYS